MADEFDDDTDFTSVAAVIDRPPQPTPQAATSSAGKVQQPKPQALPSRSGPSSIIVSTRQKGNPSLNYIRSLPWEYGDIPADYVLGATTCALFLSLKYHRLHPEYVYTRIKALGHRYNLRILLTMVDIENHEESLKELSKTSLVNDLTLILCWSAQEAGRYLELFKSYEHASPASIRAHQSTSYAEKLVDFVTVPRSINKTDAVSIVSAFGSIRGAVNAQPEQIGEITGWGEKKVQRWCSTVNERFRMKKAAKRTLGREESSIHETGEGTGNPTMPIPIGREVAKNQDVTSTGEETHTQDQHKNPQKRLASEVPLWEPDADDEDALIAASNEQQPAKAPGVDPPGSTRAKKSTKPAEALDEGVAAALAKLRND